MKEGVGLLEGLGGWVEVEVGALEGVPCPTPAEALGEGGEE